MQGEPVKSAGEELELRMTRALERVPEMAIPEDFAARVAGRLPKRRAISSSSWPALRTTRFGQIAGMLCLLALLAAMLFAGAVGDDAIGVDGRRLEVDAVRAVCGGGDVAGGLAAAGLVGCAGRFTSPLMSR